MRATWKMHFKTEQQDGDLYCKTSTLCTCASLMYHTVRLPLLFGIKTQFWQSVLFLVKREVLKSISTSMLVYTTGQITSFHIILQGRSGEKILHESYSTVCTSSSSWITQIVQYSCLAPSLKAARQKIGGGEKRTDQKRRRRRVWRQNQEERERERERDTGRIRRRGDL